MFLRCHGKASKVEQNREIAQEKNVSKLGQTEGRTNKSKVTKSSAHEDELIKPIEV